MLSPPVALPDIAHSIEPLHALTQPDGRHVQRYTPLLASMTISVTFDDRHNIRSRKRILALRDDVDSPLGV